MAAKKGDKKNWLSANDLRAMNVDELKKKLADEEEELMRARFSHATAALEDTALLKTKRRQIARIATILNEKQSRV